MSTFKIWLPFPKQQLQRNIGKLPGFLKFSLCHFTKVKKVTDPFFSLDRTSPTINTMGTSEIETSCSTDYLIVSFHPYFKPPIRYISHLL